MSIVVTQGVNNVIIKVSYDWVYEDKVNFIGNINAPTLDLDFSKYDTFQAILTENLKITFSNEIPKEITLSVIGDFTLDFENPVIYTNGNYDGTVINNIKIKYVSKLEIYVDIQKQVSTYIDTEPRYTPIFPVYNGNILTVGVGGTYSTITDAYAAAIDGDIIKLLNDIDTTLETGGYLQFNIKKNVKITADFKDIKIFSAANEFYNVRIRQTGILMFENVTISTDENNTIDIGLSNYIAGSEVYFKNCIITNNTDSSRTISYWGLNYDTSMYFENTILKQLGAGVTFAAQQTTADVNLYFSRCIFQDTILSSNRLFTIGSGTVGKIYIYNCEFEQYSNEFILKIGEDINVPIHTNLYADLRENKFTYKNNAYGQGVMLGRGTDNIKFINNKIYATPDVSIGTSVGLFIRTINTGTGAIIKGNVINSPRAIYVKGGSNIDIQYNYCNSKALSLVLPSFYIVNTLVELPLNCENIIFKNNSAFGNNTAIGFRTETTEPISTTKLTWEFNNNKYFSNTGIYLVSELESYTFAEKTDFWNEDDNSIFID